MRTSILWGCLMLGLSSLSMAGQIYKWVDAQGVTHFDAQPPAGGQAAQVTLPAAPPPTAAPTPKPASTVDREQLAVDAKVKQQVAEQEKQRKAYCDSARTNLAQLRNNPRVMESVAGELRRMSEEQRQARINEMQKAIDQNCR